MDVSPRGIAALIAHEGIVPAPYLDSVGVWTWGVGHTAAAGYPNPASLPRGVPADLDAALAEVFKVFTDDLETYSEAVRRAIKVPVAQHEFDAAVSFHYNTGRIATATWVKTLNGGNRALAADQIMNWRSPSEIIPRRTAEQTLFRDGIYPDARGTVWNVSASGRVIWSALKTLSADDIAELMGGEQLPATPSAGPETAPDTASHDGALAFAQIRRIVAEFEANE
ncbi:lysozyme [Sulfitobacter undariae]|uniref:Lysozyme n=1 Tax=Sulfitobacter undariae TaxID=1563671 RepID=A0A7W6E5V0_9RHOB|nr:lysozyme [Sulfitobacter undariae]MBB3995318.1 lysozyme [Sulfitobacter undariae]